MLTCYNTCLCALQATGRQAGTMGNGYSCTAAIKFHASTAWQSQLETVCPTKRVHGLVLVSACRVCGHCLVEELNLTFHSLIFDSRSCSAGYAWPCPPCPLRREKKPALLLYQLGSKTKATMLMVSVSITIALTSSHHHPYCHHHHHHQHHRPLIITGHATCYAALPSLDIRGGGFCTSVQLRHSPKMIKQRRLPLELSTR